MTRFRSFTLFSLLVFIATPLVACQGTDLCARAAEHIEQCLGHAAQPSATCEPQVAEDVLAQTCDELAAAESNGKADFIDFMCNTFGVLCHRCANLGGVCLASPGDSSAAAQCSAWGSTPIDATCRGNTTCCEMPVGCAEHGGCLVGAEPDTSFVTEDAEILYTSGAGISRIALDGSDQELLIDADLFFLDADASAGTLILGDHSDRLYVGNTSTGELREVDSVGERLDSAALSPDGRTVAVTRHPEPGGTVEDYSTDVWLVDVESLELIANLVGETSDGPNPVWWAESGRELYLLKLFLGEWERIDVSDGSRTVGDDAAWPPHDRHERRIAPITECKATGEVVSARSDNTGIDLFAPGSDAPRRLVRLVDFPAGPHESIHSVSFTRSCEHVLFEFDRRIWVVEVEGGRLGQLADGSHSFEAP